MAAEPLRAGLPSRVSLRSRPGGPVVRKQALGPGAAERLRHEESILRRLTGVAGVVQLAEPSAPGVLTLEYLDGLPLGRRPEPLPVPELVEFMRELATTLAAVHARGVIHRAINPDNILVTRRLAPVLVGFGQATTIATLRPEFGHHDELGGALIYLAPEQGGRTGRPVDQRADLYALGVVLYEQTTGSTPFAATDPLRLSHEQLTRIPTLPIRLRPTLPEPLSEIIMHLLETEPDNRYQTADGLVHDLTLLQRDLPPATAGTAGSWEVGRQDFPARLRSPSRLAGREHEIAVLAEALTAATSGQCTGVLISGGPGVGKSALIDELRPIAAASHGWFVSGKFDQFRRDQEVDAVYQAFRGLGRLLLAEPEADLAELRARLREGLGDNAALSAAAVPEMASVLDLPPVRPVIDPLTWEARLQRTGVETLRIIASPKRPLVLVVDDLQWANATALGFLDAVFSGEQLDGVLVVGAYRDADITPTHPLAPLLARWREGADSVVQLRVDNLPATAQVGMVADMLRLEPARARELVGIIGPRSHGNPYDTVEILNSLRHHGLLVSSSAGWRWEPDRVRRQLQQADVAGLLAERADALPPPTGSMVRAMACLGGRVEVDVLARATGAAEATVTERLAPALEDGLLVLEPGVREAVRFRHDRVHETVLRRIGADRQAELRLRLARALTPYPELAGLAADQYLPVVTTLTDPAERRRVAELLRRAAGLAWRLSNHQTVEQCLGAARRLLEPPDPGDQLDPGERPDRAELVDIDVERQAALFCLGRFTEADQLFAEVTRLSTGALERVPATLTQLSSLLSRSRPEEAIELGLGTLRELGCRVPPPARMGAEIGQRLGEVGAWLAGTAGQADAEDSRPEVTDPVKCAIGELLNRLIGAAFFADPVLAAWLPLEAWRRWVADGPCPPLVAPMSHLAYVTIGAGDYHTGPRVAARALAVSEARGYQPATSHARFTTALAGCWSQPLEQTVAAARRAREGLIRAGDLHHASFTYHVSVYNLFEFAPTLDTAVAEIEAGHAFAMRIGNIAAAAGFDNYRRLVRILRGETDGPTELLVPEAQQGNRPAMAGTHLTRALAAALFNDWQTVHHHTTAVKPVLEVFSGAYLLSMWYLLQALALTHRGRHAGPEERATILSEVDGMVEWLAARSADAPENFEHMLRLVEAERAWTAGQFRAAVQAFDAAQGFDGGGQVAGWRRPWHQALALERAGRFYLAHGLEHTGRHLLAQARRAYADWGATAKVDQLDWAYPMLEAGETAPAALDLPARRGTVMSGTIDLLGILTASQALSSETNVAGLQERVEQVLSAMTGATAVHLLLWDEPGQRWLAGPRAGGTPETSDDPPAGGDGADQLNVPDPRRVPLSAVRYAERTGEPLVVTDATGDDRFRQDPYLAGLQRCSLLAAPVLSQGRLKAMLVLENRLIRGAFATSRLDGVMLIAGQLAVSLDNAMVYASLERRVAERTEELAAANQRLAALSVTDALTDLANRRRLEEVLRAEWLRSQRTGHPVSMAMADIDHFKVYNDHYGHAAGDRCLQRVAALLRSQVRTTDLVARYGGEEFAVVMPATDLATAAQVAERMRAAVRSHGEPHARAPERVVTVSIGVAAAMPAPDDQVDALIEQADIELYRAKRGGRNQIRPAPERLP